MSSPDHGIVGRVRNAHGIRGELVVEALTNAPDAVFASGRRLLAGTVGGGLAAGAPELFVQRSRPFKGGWIVAFDKITDRNQAELWRDRYLLLPADELTPPAEDEVFQHDLLGMRVERVTGEVVGAVSALYELPQGLMLEVGEGRGAVLLPYRPEVILRVDVDARTIVVDPPVGLLDPSEAATEEGDE
jgi:16S rRNA processing protein RimM